MEGQPLSKQQAQELFRQFIERNEQLERLAAEYYTAPEAGRAALLLANPDLQEELESQAAQRSIVEARQSAVHNEGHRIIF